MAKIIAIGWSTKFLVPDSKLAAFVEMLGSVHLVEGSELLQTLKPVEFEIKTPHPDLGREISQREKDLEKAASDNNTKWYAEYNKANSLTKELAAVKAQIDLLVEKGIKSASCPQETDKVQVSTTLDKELPL